MILQTFRSVIFNICNTFLGCIRRARRTAEALDKLGWKPSSKEGEVAYAIAHGDWNRCVEIGTPAVESLIAVLQDEEAGYSRNQAAMALGRIGHPQAIKSLSMALRDKNVTVMGAVAEALGKIGTPDVVEVLGETLKGESLHEFACKWIAQALVRIGTTEAIQALGAALMSGSTLTIRRCAAEALAGIEHPQALTALIAGLRDDDSDVRHIAVSAMEKQGDARAIMPLIELTHDEKVGNLVITALRNVLRRYASEADSEGLRAVLSIGKVVNLERNPYYCANDPNDTPSFRGDIDSSEVRQLARQELIRRGLEA